MKKILLSIYFNACRFFSTISYFFYLQQKTFDVLSQDDTVDAVLKNPNLCIARFGDGEYQMILGGETGFQQQDKKLAKRLQEVLISDSCNCMVCLPRPFANLNLLGPKSYIFWRKYIGDHRSMILKLTPGHKTYGDACFTRFYLENKEYDVDAYIAKLKKLWDNKVIYIVEGENTKFGVGNSLLNNAKDVKRLLCPPTNAFSRYDMIYQSIQKYVPEGSLILIALGMTATVLAYDLSKLNRSYQALDVGHLDIEYEWYLRKSKSVVKIPGKAVNEAGCNKPIENIVNDEYIQSIVKQII